VVGIENWQDYVDHDPGLLRPAEVDVLVGDAAKARRELDWAPTLSFPELVRMMVESDLEHLQAAKNDTGLGIPRR
jgi:GDPmannose 4,6-dehydratase